MKRNKEVSTRFRTHDNSIVFPHSSERGEMSMALRWRLEAAGRAAPKRVEASSVHQGRDGSSKFGESVKRLSNV